MTGYIINIESKKINNIQSINQKIKLKEIKNEKNY